MADSINTLPGGGQSPNANTGGVLVGQLLGERYRVVGEIGRGGMATVYVAEHMLIGRQVAIKVLHPQFAENAECVRRFLAEGRTAGTLGHPNIVESTDMGFTANGAPFMVLELLDGCNLEDEIKRHGKLPTRRAARIGIQIASALAAAHAKGIIHRDLKSPNIFLIEPGSRDHVKVLDFGISKFVETAGQTQRGMLFGTPTFMSPEQVSDPATVDRRTDVYSLGVILYEMLSGRLPFDQTTFPLIFAKILSEEPTAVEKLRPDLPPELAEIIHKAMAKSLDQRTKSMEELGAALARFAGHDPAAAAGRDIAREDRREIGNKVTLPRPVPPPGRLPLGGEAPPVYGTPPIYATVLDAPPETTPSMELEAVYRVRRRRLIYAGAALAGSVLLLVTWSASRSSRHAPEGRGQPVSRFGMDLSAGETAPPTDRGSATALPPTALPEPAATSPAIPPPAALPARVRLVVESSTHGAKMTFRGQTYRLPFDQEVASAAEPELIEISAHGRETALETIALDQERRIEVKLERRSSRSSSHDESTSSDESGADVPALDRDSSAAAATSPGGSAASAATAAPATGAATVGAATTGPAGGAADAVGNASHAGDDRSVSRATSAPATSPPPPRPGTMDEAATRRVVRSHLGRIQECVDRGRMDNPQLAGDVWVEIGVSGSGKVTSARITRQSTLRNRSVESCIAAEIETWTLPAPAGGVDTAINYKFPFR